MKNRYEEFPFLKENVYLDNAAGTLKPKSVVDAVSRFYLEYPINPHNIDSDAGVKVYSMIEEARKVNADLINALPNEIIFTSGTTDSINRIASMLEPVLKEGDEILISYFNHASNIIPWIEIAKKTGAKVVYSQDLIKDINNNTKIVAYAQMNNGLAAKVDHEALYAEVKEFGAVLVNDAAQSIGHESVDMDNADIIAYSGNKLYGPTGIGVLAVRQELLEVLNPVTYGGGATASVKDSDWVKKEGVASFEAGTPNTAGIIGLMEGIKFFNKIREDIHYEEELALYAYEELEKIDGMNMLSEKGDHVVLFNYKNYSAQDVCSYLGHRKIFLRGGEFCAKATKHVVDFNYAIRLSVAYYNTKEDIDKTIDAIKNGGDFIDL